MISLLKIQKWMEENNKDVLLINRTDEFLSEYIAPYAERLQWLTIGASPASHRECSHHTRPCRGAGSQVPHRAVMPPAPPCLHRLSAQAPPPPPSTTSQVWWLHGGPMLLTHLSTGPLISPQAYTSGEGTATLKLKALLA